MSTQLTYQRHAEFINELRIAAEKYFKKNSYNTHPKMPYCLDEWKNWKNNIIVEEVYNYILNNRKHAASNNNSFPLHKYVHHGLSSQAMIFNLIGPLIVMNHYEPLIKVFEKGGVTMSPDSYVEFEYEDRSVFNEGNGQPTSLDLVVKNAVGTPYLFIESKLVETEFGGCSLFEKGDCNGRNPIHDKSLCYLHSVKQRKYFNLIEKHGFKDTLLTQKICVFINYYQFFRELLFTLEKNGIFILISDNRSSVFDHPKKGLIPFLLEFVPTQHKDKIVLISIQQIVEMISQYQMHQSWIVEFKKKYAISN